LFSDERLSQNEISSETIIRKFPIYMYLKHKIYDSKLLKHDEPLNLLEILFSDNDFCLFQKHWLQETGVRNHYD
jgi:hypothetical protein